jgi:hypothetical protein
VACASLSAAAPIVCATHSDQLPAGAEADAAARTATTSEPAGHRAWWLAGVGVLVVAALGGGVLTRQRRKNRPPATVD